MLTLFILPSKGSGDVKKLVDSFTLKDLSVRFVPVDDVSQINGYDKKTPWFGVFYENEYIGEELAESLSSFFTMGDHDFLVVFKKLEDKALFFPRFFKSGIFIQDDLTPLFPGWKHEKILNGWVYGSSS